jgi:hypothetical protein
LEGDTDRNGRIDTTDAYLILIYYVEHSIGNASYTFTEYPSLEEQLILMLDINGDHKIDTQDAYLVLKYYALQSVGETVDWDTLE